MIDCDHIWKVSEWGVNTVTFNFVAKYICMKCEQPKED